MKTINNLDKVDEVKRLYQEGLNFNAALRKTADLFRKESHSATDQSIQNDHNKINKDIISQN